MKTSFCVLLLMSLGSVIVNADMLKNKVIVGWIEKVRVLPEDLVMHAKIDTGADNSSINALKPKEFTKDGRNWIRFTLKNREGKAITLERPIVRIAKIKKRKSESRQHRPVVMLGLCIGNMYREVEVNLADRRRFKYQLLIGRSFMRDKLLVDPSATYTVEPVCSEAPKN
jgi:hypothetical protein